jgi:hypothetical protein
MNRNSRIRFRRTKNDKVRTETHQRDDGLNVAVTTSPRTNTTRLFIDTDDGSICLPGSVAKTLLRVLLRHYTALGKTIPEPSYWQCLGDEDVLTTKGT